MPQRPHDPAATTARFSRNDRTIRLQRPHDAGSLSEHISGSQESPPARCEKGRGLSEKRFGLSMKRLRPLQKNVPTFSDASADLKNRMTKNNTFFKKNIILFGILFFLSTFAA